MGKEGSLSPLTSPPREGEPPHHPQPSLLSHLSNPAALIFLPLSTSLGGKSAPSSQAESQKQCTRSRNSKGQRSHLGKSIFGCEGASPGASGEGKGRQAPSPGAGSEVHAPGGLTDARERRMREGGNRNGCRVPERKRVLCFDVASRFCFLSLDCKKLLWRPAHPAGDAHVHREVLAARARRRSSAPEKSRAGRAAGSWWLQVMRFSFFLFLSFFFSFSFSISLKYLQQWGRRKRREGRGKRAP